MSKTIGSSQLVGLKIINKVAFPPSHLLFHPLPFLNLFLIFLSNLSSISSTISSSSPIFLSLPFPPSSISFSPPFPQSHLPFPLVSFFLKLLFSPPFPCLAPPASYVFLLILGHCLERICCRINTIFCLFFFRAG